VLARNLPVGLGSKFGDALPVMRLDVDEIRNAVRAALSEDIGGGDATSLACISESSSSHAVIRARVPIVLSGISFAEIAFRELSTALQVDRCAEDGALVPADGHVLRLRGSTRAILSGERVALNFLQRLSAVATMTRKYVDAVAGTGVEILDTRKTTPGWRRFEKYAVSCGGGTNHRMGLYDQVLIKDNHLAALSAERPNPVAAAVDRARALFPGLRIEVEADTLQQAVWAAERRADIILLDNMSLAQLREAVILVAGRSRTEASGGVTLGSVRAIAETGVNMISVGAITHSAGSVDLGLDFPA
jgi:nicotinate-nucleotide pyrophosphorylase (carboxylating)